VEITQNVADVLGQECAKAAWIAEDCDSLKTFYLMLSSFTVFETASNFHSTVHFSGSQF
jgi:hypothetical protein